MEMVENLIIYICKHIYFKNLKTDLKNKKFKQQNARLNFFNFLLPKVSSNIEESFEIVSNL